MSAHDLKIKDIQLTQNGRFFFGWWMVILGLLLMMFAYVGFVSLTSVCLAGILRILAFKFSKTNLHEDRRGKIMVVECELK